jgi:hypothetical protein
MWEKSEPSGSLFGVQALAALGFFKEEFREERDK